MKRCIRIIVCFVLALALAGCGDTSKQDQVSDPGTEVADTDSPSSVPVDNNTDNNTESMTDSSEVNPVDSTEDYRAVADDNLRIDVDLTMLSSTMVYSEVYNMTMTPDDYVGKIVKMEGICDCYHDESNGNDYYACIIQDATACCSQGIEFVLADGSYPEVGQNVCVVGRFETYQENDYTYCRLSGARILL